MKTFYTASIILGLLVLAAFQLVTIAPPPGSNTAYRLSKEPKKWQIQITEENIILGSEEEMKEGILTFIESHRGSEYDDVPYGTAVGFTLIIFGSLGVYRESILNKKLRSDQGDADNPCNPPENP